MTKSRIGLVVFSAALFGATPAPTLAQEPLAVEIVEVQATSEPRRSSLTGEIQASQSLMAAFPIGGRVTEVMVELGEMVEQGEALAQLDSIQQELAVRAAEAGLVTARADHVQAKEEFDRAEALLTSGAGTRAVRDAAEDQLRAAEGALAQAEAELDRAKKALLDTVLRAPSPSTVIQRMIEPGQIIGAAQPALELALDNGLQAVFEVSEAMLIEGAPSVIELSRLSSPQDTFEGVVSEISPLVDAVTGTVAVKVAIPNPPDRITYGDPVRGTATLSQGQLINLPFDAMTASADGPAVWKVDPQTMQVSLHNVEVERYATGEVLLAGGVEDGEWIVTRGAQLLYPGRIVRRAEAEQ
ncbi:MAG: efflux RND transporter periplasmic adaptor subunit [Hoeflea sp.]|uniref:efflux RND transporter periplasmic adaptor subunit n=1 Tax=Hoeflea sp. TaxID=1940281 RepID=UPI0032ED8283